MEPITRGTHHIGLTVSRLNESAAFFIEQLGWKEVGRRDEYPAIFVSDGKIVLTLWSTKSDSVVSFDKNKNVGLHHIAFMVESEAALMEVYTRLNQHQTKIEFAPELLRQGPAKHMMCYEPSGVRVEFIWPGN